MKSEHNQLLSKRSLPHVIRGGLLSRRIIGCHDPLEILPAHALFWSHEHRTQQTDLLIHPEEKWGGAGFLFLHPVHSCGTTGTEARSGFFYCASFAINPTNPTTNFIIQFQFSFRCCAVNCCQFTAVTEKCCRNTASARKMDYSNLNSKSDLLCLFLLSRSYFNQETNWLNSSMK